MKILQNYELPADFAISTFLVLETPGFKRQSSSNKCTESRKHAKDTILEKADVVSRMF